MPSCQVLHHFVVSFRGPRRPPNPSPERSLAPFSVYSKKKILLFKILMKPLFVTQIFWNGEERTRLWLQVTEHICGNLWQIFWNGEERTRLWLQLTEHSVVICDTDILEWWGKDQIVIITNRTYLWSFVTQIFWNGEERTRLWLQLTEHICGH
jgi:hypothetical protein